MGSISAELHTLEGLTPEEVQDEAFMDALLARLAPLLNQTGSQVFSFHDGSWRPFSKCRKGIVLINIGVIMMSMKHNKLLLIISGGILLFGVQTLLAEPVAKELDDLQAQAREAIAATRAQLQSQEPFSEPVPTFAPQKSAPTRRSEDMPAVENAKIPKPVVDKAKEYGKKAYDYGKKVYNEYNDNKGAKNGVRKNSLIQDSVKAMKDSPEKKKEKKESL